MGAREAIKNGGLSGVVVADTALSEVDGERGRLTIAGYEVERLAEIARFEDAAGLLWDGELPLPERREELRRELAAGRVTAFARLGDLGKALAAADGMDALRAGLAHLPESATPAAVVGATAVFAAAWSRLSRGEAPLAPNPAASHAADYLCMTSGAGAAEGRVRALDAYLVTVMDHGMNASTFAARVVASTASDLVSSVVAAVGALKGPLHGGAPGPVLDMLDAIGAPDRAGAYIEAELAAGRRIMGMGHRIYRVRDPRALVLEKAALALEGSGLGTPRLALARAVERVAEGALRDRYPDRPLHANVEFYTAVLLDAVGLSRTLFTPTFAVGRAVGWCAHVLEQQRAGKLIRPESRYVGPRPSA
jgi:citrate synthase